MELHDAITHITEIRAQIARTEIFRGYRSVTVGFSGLIALVTAMLQPWVVPDPARQMTDYLTLWFGAAALCLVVVAAEMSLRCHRAASPWTTRLTWMAVEQFLPCLVAGGLLTFVMLESATESLWMLPGLWSILFSLGVFASSRLLPQPVFWVGCFYLVAGVAHVTLGRGESAFSPWAMAVPFGTGQLAVASILYYHLERDHE
jgi:hypothetical protein